MDHRQVQQSQAAAAGVPPQGPHGGGDDDARQHGNSVGLHQASQQDALTDGAGSPQEGGMSRSRSHSRERRRSGHRGRSKSRSPSHSRSRSRDGSKERRHRKHRHRSSKSRDQRLWKSKSRGRSRSHSRSRSRSGSRKGSSPHEHRHHRSQHHKHPDKQPHAEHSHHHHHHHHHQRKRSRSRSKSQPAAQQLPPALQGPFADSRAKLVLVASATAAPSGSSPSPQGHSPARRSPGQQEIDVCEEDLLRRNSSGGASSLVKLSLQQQQHPPSAAPSPAAAAAAAALLPGRRRGPSPLGPPGMSLARLQTPTAAELAASHGLDVSDVALIQPSPMAAEATVAALSALMQQPARVPPLLPVALPGAALHHQSKRSGAGLGGAAADKKKQLLSFGDELDEDELESAGSGGPVRAPLPGMSAATAKRFKHEKTLVMLNPSLSGELQAHPLAAYDDTESLPCSPAAPLDKRLGHVLWGSAQAKGMRPYMEDRHTIINSFQPRTSTGQAVQDGVFRAYAAVFDGHNGASAAEHVAERLHHVLAAEPAIRTCTGEGPPATQLQEEERVAAALVHAFEWVDREIMTRCRLEGTKGGATGLVVLRLGNQLYAAHCGDTRAVMSRNGEALRLTEDHKPNLPRERKRVEGMGGRVDFARCWRVIVEPGDGRPASGLAVSRSFGDPDFKEPLHLVTATPDVIRERLQPGDEFVILASDGLWDVLTDSEACTVVRRHLQQSGAPRQITPPQLLPGAAAFGAGTLADQFRRPPVLTAALAAAAAERLVQESLDRGTMDNVTAVVGILQWD